jgi:hypothetical protein
LTDFTNNYGWTIPDEYSDPWYAAFLSLLNEVDAQVKANDDAIVAIQNGVVYKSLFDANTILAADTDDTPAALTIAEGEIVGRLSGGNIDGLTASQVASLVEGNISHNATNGINTGDYIHTDPSPLAGGTGWSVDDTDFIVGGADEASVKPVDYSEIESFFITSRDYRRVAANCKYVAINDNVSSMYIFDRNTGEEMKTISGVAGTSPFVFISESEIVQVTNNLITLIDVVSGTVSIKNTSSTVDTTSDVCFHSGKCYWITQSTQSLQTIDVSTWFLTSVSTAGFSGNAFAIDTDGTHTYSLDADTGSATSYVRKHLISSGALIASSAGFTTAKGEFSALYLEGTRIFVTTDTGTAAGDMQCQIYNTSMTQLFTGATEVTHDRSHIDNCVSVAIREFDVSFFELLIIQVPSLTQKSPRHLDLSGVESSEYNYEGGNYTLDDFARGAIHSKDGSVHVDPTPASGGTGWSVDDTDFIVDGTDEASVKPVGLTLLRDVVYGSNFNIMWAAAGDIVANIISSNINVVDKNTSDVLATGAVGITAPIAVNINNFAYLIASTYVRIVNLSDFDYSDVAVSNGTVYDAKFGPDNLLYYVNTSGTYFVRDDVGAADSSGSLTGLTQAPVSIAVDDTNLYVLDAPHSTSGAVTLRKFDLATFTLQTSLSLTASVVGEKWSRIEICGDNIVLSYSEGDGTSAANQTVHYINKNTMASVLYSETTIALGYKGTIHDGSIYTADSDSYRVYTLPGLFMSAPKGLDLSDVKTSNLQADGVRGTYTLSDLVRSRVVGKQLDNTRLGPAEIIAYTSETPAAASILSSNTWPVADLSGLTSTFNSPGISLQTVTYPASTTTAAQVISAINGQATGVTAEADGSGNVRVYTDIEDYRQKLEFGGTATSIIWDWEANGEGIFAAEPFVGDRYAFKNDGAAHGGMFAEYRQDGWHYYTALDNSRLYCSAERYTYVYQDGDWYPQIDWVMTATTNDGAGTGDSAVMAFDGASEVPINPVERYESPVNLHRNWVLEIELSASQSFDVPTSFNPSQGLWTFRGVAIPYKDSTPFFSTVNGSSQKNFTAVAASSIFTLPTIKISVASGLEITVEHTSSTAGDVQWNARVKGHVGDIGVGAEVSA